MLKLPGYFVTEGALAWTARQKFFVGRIKGRGESRGKGLKQAPLTQLCSTEKRFSTRFGRKRKTAGEGGSAAGAKERIWKHAKAIAAI